MNKIYSHPRRLTKYTARQHVVTPAHAVKVSDNAYAVARYCTCARDTSEIARVYLPGLFKFSLLGNLGDLGRDQTIFFEAYYHTIEKCLEVLGYGRIRNYLLLIRRRIQYLQKKYARGHLRSLVRLVPKNTFNNSLWGWLAHEIERKREKLLARQLKEKY